MKKKDNQVHSGINTSLFYIGVLNILFGVVGYFMRWSNNRRVLISLAVGVILIVIHYVQDYKAKNRHKGI